MVCCKSFGKLHYLFLGLAAGCSVVAMVILVVYCGTWLNTGLNMYKQYYVGREGTIGSLVMLLAVVPILSLACLAVGTVFFICCCDKCCCKVIAWVFSMIGAVLFLVLICVQAVTIKYCEYGDMDQLVNRKEYDMSDDQEFQAYVDAASKAYTYDSPVQSYFSKFVVLVPRSVPVCYFATDQDKKDYKAKDCIGRWSGSRVKNYHEDDKEETSKIPERDTEDWAKYMVHNTRFSMNVMGYVVSLTLGMSVAAVACGVLWVFMRCCCVKSD